MTDKELIILALEEEYQALDGAIKAFGTGPYPIVASLQHLQSTIGRLKYRLSAPRCSQCSSILDAGDGAKWSCPNCKIVMLIPKTT